MYRDDNRPRSGQSNNITSRDRLYYTPNDYQPAQCRHNPYPLAPLNFSPPREKESYKLLAGTRFDDLANSPDTEHFKISPPAPMRPPPPPPARHNIPPPHPNADHSRVSIYLQGTLSTNETDTPVRNVSRRDSADEKWPLEAVIEFLRLNGFGEPWQKAFCA